MTGVDGSTGGGSGARGSGTKGNRGVAIGGAGARGSGAVGGGRKMENGALGGWLCGWREKGYGDSGGMLDIGSDDKRAATLAAGELCVGAGWEKLLVAFGGPGERGGPGGWSGI